MFSKSIMLSLIMLLAACQVTQPPPYQKDRKPEDRTEYNGAEGMVQQQKDQNYLMSKELTDKCTDAKIDLAIAEANKKANEIKKQKSLIKEMCV